MEVGESSPTVAIQSQFMSSNDYFIKFTCHDFNAKLEQDAVI